MIGNYLGSSSDICSLGEYGGFFFSRRVAAEEFARVPSIFKARYLREIQEHAVEFPTNVAVERGSTAYCDSTPGNLLIARDLVELLPTALFILTLRHYTGTIQSLRRSHQQGYQWAGATDIAAAELWATCYANVTALPPERTIAIGYDQLCRDAGNCLDRFHSALGNHGLDPAKLNLAVLTESHANPHGAHRPTVGTMVDGEVQLIQRSSFDPSEWRRENEAQVGRAVRRVEVLLRDRFVGLYEEPFYRQG